MFSADYYPDDEDAQPSKLDQWLEKHISGGKAPERRWCGVSVLLCLGLSHAAVHAAAHVSRRGCSMPGHRRRSTTSSRAL